MQKNIFVKVYNEIFEYQLHDYAFKVYVHLSGTFFWKNNVTIKFETIAQKCQMSINTAQKAIKELIDKNLIVKNKRYKKHYRTTNNYTIKKLSGGFFMLNKRLLKLKLDNRAFFVLSYIGKCANQGSKSFPSFKQIKENTLLGRTTVIAKVKLLNDMGLIYKVNNFCQNNVFGHNIYTVIDMKVRLILIYMLNYFAEQQQYLAKEDCSYRILSNQFVAKIIIILNILLMPLRNIQNFYYFFTHSGANFAKRIIDPLKYVTTEKIIK